MHSRSSHVCCVQLPGIRYELIRLHRHSHGHHIEPIATVRTNRVRLPILAVISRTGKMNISLSPTAPENFVLRDRFGSSVPRQPAHLHTYTESGAYLGDSSRFPRRRPFIYLNRHTPSSCRYRFFMSPFRRSLFRVDAQISTRHMRHLGEVTVYVRIFIICTLERDQ